MQCLQISQIKNIPEIGFMRTGQKILAVVVVLCSVVLYTDDLSARDVVYMHEDKYGRKIYSDRLPANPRQAKRLELTITKGWVERELGAPGSHPNYNWLENQQRFDPEIRRLAAQYNLSHTLVHAVITAESSYDPNAVSRAGAVGLMQLMPKTAADYGVSDRRNPLQNMHAGVRHLDYLLTRYDNNLKLALAAYNAGESAVERYNYQIPPYQETRRYVSKVLEYFRRYSDSKHVLSKL